MNLEKAIQGHAEWKLKFRAAITRKERMDAVVIGADDRCALGQWLHGEGKTRFGGLQGHAECLRRHALFHREAGRVARTINEGKYAEAEALLGETTTYTQVSREVASAIMRLKKEAKL